MVRTHSLKNKTHRIYPIIYRQTQQYILSMNNEQFRRTFAWHNHSLNESPLKKKSRPMVKLPTVKIVQQEAGNYILGDLIGEGGYAKVRLCKRKKDGEQFVVKIFDKFKLTTEDKRKSINREVEILKCIKHPTIIKIIDFFQTNQTINIVMEYFSLTSLVNYAKSQRPLPDHTLRSIVKQLAEAINYLHKLKIAHRDIKPQNILINEYNQIKVIDLGLSMMGEHSEVKIAGTPYYMSPELTLKKQYDPFQADIWAFGILLYWLVLGYFPQDTSNDRKRRLSKTFQLHFPIDMHPGIEYLISKMLQQEPQNRITAQQILIDTWVQPKDFKNQISKLIKNLSK